MDDTATTTDRRTDGQTSPATRRTFLAVAAGGAAAAVGAAPGSAGDGDPERIELGGRTAGWTGRAPDEIDGETNPTLSLTAGRTYEVVWENVDGAPHNFVVLDGDGETLVETEIVSQMGATQTVELTASEEMAEYRCAVHPTTMVGDVSVEEAGDEDEEAEDDAEPPEETVFEREVVEEQVGDVAALTLAIAEDDGPVSIAIGGETVNYAVSFVVADGNDDSEVTVEFDTFVAGQGEASPVGTAAQDDVLRDVQIDLGGIGEPLDPAPYPVRASVDGRVASVATIALQPRETVAARAGVAPALADPGADEAFSERVSRRDEVAAGDWAAIEFEASGLYATLADVGDLRNDDLGYDLTVEEADVINRPPREVPLDAISLLTDPENDRFFAVLDSDRLAVGDAYEASFTISDANPYVPEGEEETVSDEFTVVERTATIDAEEPVSVPPETVTFSGTTTVAPGSAVTLWAAGEGGDGFQAVDLTTVESEGTWSASIDFSDVDPGTPFTLQVLGLSDDLDGEVTAR